jgi:putative transposase
MDAFFSEADYREYLYVMAEWCNRCKVQPLLLLIPNLRELLAGDLSAEEYETLRRHERTGRPLGSADFTEKVEKMTARVLRRQKPGPQKQ